MDLPFFLAVRIVSIDHVLLPPGPLDRSFAPFSSAGTAPGLPPELIKLPWVPVIRIFGPIQGSNQRACIHIHGVFPYLLVPYDGDPRPEPLSQFIERFARAINAALSLPANKLTSIPADYEGTPKQRSETSDTLVARHDDTLPIQNGMTHVVAIVPNRAYPFYGYHPNPAIYLKIYLADPKARTRLSLLLSSGAILHTAMQPHESHIPFHLQFLADHGLDGMGWMKLSWALARHPLHPQSLPRAKTDLSSFALPPSMQWSAEFPFASRRTSHCSIEADTHALAICNYHARKADRLPLTLASFNTQSRSNSDSPVRLIPSLKALWDEEHCRRSLLDLPPYMHNKPESKLGPKSASCTDFLGEHYKTELGAFFQERRRQRMSACADPLLDPDVLDAIKNISWIQDSVSDLWPQSLQPNLSKKQVRDRGYFSQKPRGSLAKGPAIPLAHSSEIDAYPDLIQFTQLVMSQKEGSSHEPVSAQSSQTLSEFDVQLTQTVLKWMIDNAPLEDESVLNEEEDKYEINQADILSESDHDEDESWLATVELDEAHGFILEEGLGQNGGERINNQSQPTSDFEMDDGHNILIPQYDGPGDSYNDNVPMRRQLPSKVPGARFNKITVDRAAFSTIVDAHEGRGSISPSTDIPSCISVVKGTRSPTIGSTRPPILQPISENWRLQTSAGDLLTDQATATYAKPDGLSTDISSSVLSTQFSEVLDENQLFLGNTQDVSVSGNDSTNVQFETSQSQLDQPSERIHSLGKEGRFLLFVYTNPPPNIELSERALLDAGISLQLHQTPFYGDPCDGHLASRPHIFAGRTHRIPLLSHRERVSFQSVEHILGGNVLECRSDVAPVNEVLQRYKCWTYAISPPTIAEARVLSKQCDKTLDIKTILQLHQRKRKQDAVALSQLENIPGGVTQMHVPAISQRPKSGRTKSLAKELGEEPNSLLCLGIEIHVNTRGDLLPDPVHDAVQAIFFVLYSDTGVLSAGETYLECSWGQLSVQDGSSPVLAPNNSTYFQSEAALLQGLVDLTLHWDPDVILGYDVHSRSWGFLIERCSRVFDYDLTLRISRIIAKQGTHQAGLNSAWGIRKGTPYSIIGRIVLDVWRLLRSELALTNYSLENVVKEVLKRRMPRFSPKVLTVWYCNSGTRRRTLAFGIQRVLATMQLLVTGSYLDRTAEFARVYGIEFTSVLNRGSQYRVEAVMSRLARSMGFALITPTRQQVASQRAAECLALTMEPRSAFYVNPVIVLDFQSLYPSIIIARNMCFSTCLGKLTKDGKHSTKLGCLSMYEFPASVTQDQVWVSPNGVMFLKSQRRCSLLAKVLTELLDTREMVKKSMVLYKKSGQGNHDHKKLLRLLEMRQLSLKLLANVIYGYTAASFSGRMPMVELADSVVQTGRETLDRTIRHIHSTPAWGGRIVYGDTDSVFIEVKGATKSAAFHIGRSISEAISNLNPLPIYLKFEKVYLPCILASKKRYVGHKFESPEDTNPVFDAKGIETVRRDGCAASGIILQTALEILFVHRDVSRVKKYVCRQFTKLLQGRIPMKDLIIAKEVKLGTYSNHALPPPGAYLSMQKMKTDPWTEPQYGERVPYVVAYGGPGDRLIDQVMCPRQVLQHDEFRINAHYYILKQIIPALTRLFQLFGANVAQWYHELPKPVFHAPTFTVSQSSKPMRITIDHYYAVNHCPVCKEKLPNTHSEGTIRLCPFCISNTSQTNRNVIAKLKNAEVRHAKLMHTCLDCCSFTGSLSNIECDSLCCPVLYDRIKAKRSQQKLSCLASELGIITSTE